MSKWAILYTDRYPATIKSRKRQGVRSLRLYDDHTSRKGVSARLAGSIGWFDNVNECRYVRIFTEPDKKQIKLEPINKPLANTRVVRYKNGEVFIGGGYQLRKDGYRYGKYIETKTPNVFTYMPPTPKDKKGERE